MRKQLDQQEFDRTYKLKGLADMAPSQIGMAFILLRSILRILNREVGLYP
jgi:hypothetical protein